MVPTSIAIGHDGAVPLTFPVAPMKAGIGTLPHDDERWAYEIKWDGYRTLAFVDGGQVRLQSSRLHDVTGSYPELAGLPAGVHADTAILDTELVVLDDDGRPQFNLVQRHTRPAVLFVFDVLRVGGHDTIELPYEDRRRLLDQLVEPGDHWSVPGHRIGDGAALLEATDAAGPRGRDGEAARLHLRARQAVGQLAQGEEPPARRGGDRRVHHRGGQPLGGVRRAARRAVGRRPARVRRRGRHRLRPARGSRRSARACATSPCASARSTRRRPPRTAAAPRGCSRCCGPRSRSASSRTTGFVRHSSFIDLVD